MTDTSTNSILLNLATTVGGLDGKVDNVLAEQARAADGRARLYEGIAAIDKRMAVLEAVATNVPKLEERVRVIERERSEEKGALGMAKLLWMGLAGATASAVTFLLTKFVGK